jgi:transcriptional regulator with XRE-family HTH domain
MEVITMNFGFRLKALRKEHRMLQKDLAILLDLSSDTIAKYERNQRTPNPDTLQKISDIFGVSLDYLLCKTDNPLNQTELEVLGDIGVSSEDINSIIDALIDKHGVVIGDVRYSKKELESLIAMIQTLKKWDGGKG